MTFPLGDPRVLLLALAIDLTVGELPTRIHPVAWMGRFISLARRWSPKTGRVWPMLAGFVIMAIGISLSVLGGWLILKIRDPWLLLGAQAIAAKTLFSVQKLLSAGGEVEDALRSGDLIEARRRLSWHLVSRDTTTLDEPRVAAAAIESVAENASDSIIAPWLSFLIGGLPAMAAYRFINTADAMLGYRDPEREWLGKIPARIDDLANLIPARLTAMLLLISSLAVGGGDSRRGFAIWRRDGRVTPSPNAGHPMAAMAGLLGVELEKRGAYKLGAGLRLPTADDLARARRIVRAMTLISAIGLIVIYFAFAFPFPSPAPQSGATLS